MVLVGLDSAIKNTASMQMQLSRLETTMKRIIVNLHKVDKQ